jgi:ABC-type transporter MlaC component
MTIDTTEMQKLTLNSEGASEASQEDEQALIEALERYLRQASLARAHSLPRWVMW